jgi:hypothetical protein
MEALRSPTARPALPNVAAADSPVGVLCPESLVRPRSLPAGQVSGVNISFLIHPISATNTRPTHTTAAA